MKSSRQGSGEGMDNYLRLKQCEIDIKASQEAETEAQYIIKGYPQDHASTKDGAVVFSRRCNAYVYIDSTGRLCIHGGETGGCLYIDPEDQGYIGGDVAPGH